MARGALFLKVAPWSCIEEKKSQSPSPVTISASFPHYLAISGAERTLLCMWMVYSRATTSAMAERCCVFFPFVADMVGCVRVGG